MNTRSIIFILTLFLGNFFFTWGMSYFFGTTVIESISLFTSSATAIYAIYVDMLDKTRPLLRVIPALTPGFSVGEMGMRVTITNIGDSVALDIKGESKLEGGQAIELKNGGKIVFQNLAPKEPPNLYYIIDSMPSQHILSQQSYFIKMYYKGIGGKDMEPIEIKGSVKELNEDFLTRTQRGHGRYEEAT